jgi:LEA14-like dessication related protein
MQKHVNRKLSAVLAGLALALTISACATMGRGFERPQIDLVAIRLLEIKGFESVFQVDLRVSNPNDRSLPIRGAACDLSLDGHHLAKGVAAPEKEIPAYGSEIVPVTVYASLLEMAGVAGRILQNLQRGASDEKWTYAAKGHIRLDSTVWPGKIPFASNGEIDFNELVSKQLRER